MNNKKICFITCVNDDRQYEECLLYINNLNIPEGYEIDAVSIKEAESMAAGYNAAMNSTDAKYKVYLHQDVFIINKNFILDFLSLFKKDEKIGLIGMTGSKAIAIDGSWGKSEYKYGKKYKKQNGAIELVEFNEINKSYDSAKVIDGAIMITQYDLAWREDIIDGWSFYDASQCNEFVLEGYKIVIPNQLKPWYIHECKMDKNVNDYENNRKNFIAEYYNYMLLPNQGVFGSHLLYNLGRNSHIGKEYKFIYPEGINIGKNVVVLEESYLMIPYNNFNDEPRIIIEDGCQIGKRCTISATNRVTIEKNVIMAANIHITDHNHEYKQVGIPIMYQGVTSFTNEVVIGQGSWIANNVVISGNVHIGLGCTIGANSVVNCDIPDYCVAVGSPAKVIKCFDRVSGEWIKVKNENHLAEVLGKRQTSAPLITIGIFTYNRSNYLDKCLQSIFNQIGNDNLFEILISDNNSTDDTKLVVDKYKAKYSNLKYYKNENNVGPMKNVHKVFERASGEFVIAHGDDDYLSYLSVYKLVDMIYKNRDCSIMYMLHSNKEFSIYNGTGINDYIGQVSFISTFISGMVLKKSDFSKIQDKEKFVYTDINQVYIQLELLRNNPKFAVLKGKTLDGNSGEHNPEGYNFGEVFIKNYLDILHYFTQYGLEERIIKNEKYKLLKSMIIPWCRKIITENIKLDISDIMTLFYNYYKDETYFEEANKQLQKILKQ